MLAVCIVVLVLAVCVVQLLDLNQRNLIQRAWEQLVRESGPQVSDGTTLEEVHVHRGHFNRSLLGGRFPQALEVRVEKASRERSGNTVLSGYAWRRSGSFWPSAVRTGRS